MKGTKIFGALATIAGLAAAHPHHDKRTPVGTLIESCIDPNAVALTFDDGPMDYTDTLLNRLAVAGHKATFFMNGQNWGNIYSYTGVIQRMHRENHQLGSHTWNHADLQEITFEAMKSEMCQVEQALLDIVGFASKWMRPPYLSQNGTTLGHLGQLGYRVIMIDNDSKDFESSPTEAIANYKSDYENKGGRLSLMHDVFSDTVNIIVPDILAYLAVKGKTSVTVAQCLGETKESGYVNTIGAYCSPARSSTSSKSSTKTSSSSSTKSSTSTKTTTTSSSSSTKTSSSITSTKTSSSSSSSSTKTSSSVTSTKTSSSSSSSSSSSVTSTKTSSSSSSASSSSATSTKTSSSSLSSSSTYTGTSTKTTSTASVASSSTASVASSSTATSSASTSIGSSVSSGSSSSSAPVSVPTTTTTSTRTSATSNSVSSSAPGPLSTNDRCGPSNGGAVCPSGECCSEYGWCGKSKAHCGTGCQLTFGKCDSSAQPSTLSSAVSSSGPAPSSGAVSPGGVCGGTSGFVCAPGNCCSSHGYCGVGPAYCDGGPNSGAGNGGQGNSNAGESPDGTCGGVKGYKCPGNSCCSSHGWCGTGSAWCGAGCQSPFGKCN